MLTKEINEKKFGKVLFGGYEVNEVDNYIKIIAKEMEILQEENSSLKQ